MQCVLYRTCVTTPRRQGRRCHVVCTWATSNSAARWRTSTSWFPRQRQTRCRTLRYATTLTFRSKCFSKTLHFQPHVEGVKNINGLCKELLFYEYLSKCTKHVVLNNRLQDSAFLTKIIVSGMSGTGFVSCLVGRSRALPQTNRPPFKISCARHASKFLRNLVR